MSYPELLDACQARLLEMKARCDAATPGPWFEHLSIEAAPGKSTVQVAGGWLFVASDKGTREDGRLAAHARTDLPALVGWALEFLRQIRAGMASEFYVPPDGPPPSVAALARALGIPEE